mgnify:CR=1 FL=1
MSSHDLTRLGSALIILGLAVALTVNVQLLALAGLLTIWTGTRLLSRGGQYVHPF